MAEFGEMRSSSKGPQNVPVPRSVVGDDVESGENNTGGVARPRRRGIAGKRGPSAAVHVSRNYRVADGVQFNNFQEVFQDSVSPEFAQEILEKAFNVWGLPFNQPAALKFAEDLVFAFIVAVTASDKADYNKIFDVPVEPTSGRTGGMVNSVEANMGELSNLLTREYGVTRRQLARGLADRIRMYLSDPENVHVLDDIATKVGCDRQMAGLAFDGSTHCKGMNTKEIQFTKTLENRNLFEREDQMASGASERLLNSLTNGARAVR
jgi:hypothetical protein